MLSEVSLGQQAGWRPSSKVPRGVLHHRYAWRARSTTHPASRRAPRPGSSRPSKAPHFLQCPLPPYSPFLTHTQWKLRWKPSFPFLEMFLETRYLSSWR